MADLSGEISSGGTAQTLASADVGRGSFFIKNTSDEDLYYRFGGTASASAPSIKLEPNDERWWTKEHRQIITQSISIYGATTGKTFTAMDSKGWGA